MSSLLSASYPTTGDAIGLGVKQDYAQAMTWFQKAADQGDADAQSSIGWLYANGLGVKQDYIQARAWYQKAANHGDESTKTILMRLPAN